MKGTYPLTRGKMHAVLLELLAHSETKLYYQDLENKSEGRADWDDVLPPTNISIIIDANENPTQHISTCIHELLHIALEPYFMGRLADRYLEIGVLAFEKDMFEFVVASPTRLAKWNALIARKLEPNNKLERQ